MTTPQKYSPKNEQEILNFWEKEKIFEKSLEQTKGNDEYTFYDGPPFATGLPHYGHLVAGTLKDVVPRYWTMKGYHVARRFGWDCHGLPVEYEKEKELGISGKKDIEDMGIDVFNEECRAIVQRYVEDWKVVVNRIGRWVDMENSYLTMNPDYMESIWWVVKTLWERNFIYEGLKTLPYCPRCATPLSNFEANQAYKDVYDPAITVRFKLIDQENTYVLAWTTTPWTLPANMGLAVGADIDYVKVKDNETGDNYILAQTRLEQYYRDEKEYEIVETFKGKQLDEKKYQPLFDFFAGQAEQGAFRIVIADFVSTEDGTGIVHIAPAFGEDDNRLGLEKGLPAINTLNEVGCFNDEVTTYAGMFVKDADPKIIEDLKFKNDLIKKESITHSYPHCWRCDSPLIYRAISTWFVKVTDLKQDLVRNNEQINWQPENIKFGRFGKWLQDARDWAISRNRYWGTPLPIWKCTECDEIHVIGSKQELEELSGEKVEDLHKHFVDKIEFKCGKCGATARRIPEILDCWFESGSMPYAQKHYPFEFKDNLDEFNKFFPAQFIAEGIDQTRGWFYTLLVLSTALFNEPAFKNVIVNGIVLAEDGEKMSKRLKNYPDPMEVVEKYGADALRFYLMSSPVVKAGDLRFSEKGVDEVFKKVILLLWNTFTFYKMYEDNDLLDEKVESDNLLDKWIISKLNFLVFDYTQRMEDYDLQRSTRIILEFINQLSTWYVRRSRDRFKLEDKNEKTAALQTLHTCLMTLVKVMAPFTPFITEMIYKDLTAEKDSVHLEKMPIVSKEDIDSEILNSMGIVQQIVELGQSVRAQNQLKVRQPLAEIKVDLEGMKVEKDYLAQFEQIILDELNIKKISWEENVEANKGWLTKQISKIEIAINPELTDELKQEGLIREMTRHINLFRKNQSLTINDKVELYYQTDDKDITAAIENFTDMLKKNVLAEKIERKELDDFETIKINDTEVKIYLKKI